MTITIQQKLKDHMEKKKLKVIRVSVEVVKGG
jgi:hypothetical protein